MAGVTIEQRRFTRRGVSLRGALRFHSPPALLEAHTVDLGLEGARFHAAGIVHEGAPVLVRLEFGAGQPALECKGRVCWTDEAPEGLSRFGVRFLDLRDDERELLDHYLATT
jgi:hypothetical protein